MRQAESDVPVPADSRPDQRAPHHRARSRQLHDEGRIAAERNRHWATDAKTTNTLDPRPTLLDSMPLLQSAQRVLIKSMLTRACFGGSAHDVQMVRAYATLWARRFNAENQQAAASGAPRHWLSLLDRIFSTSHLQLPSQLVHALPIDVRQVAYLHDEDLVLNGVDMHCSPIVSAESQVG